MRSCLKVLIVLTLLSSNADAEGYFSASVGGDYSTGDYGTDSSTDVWYVPFTASYQAGAFTYKVTVPWIRVTGDGGVVPSGFGGSGASSTSPTSQVVCVKPPSGPGSGRRVCTTVVTPGVTTPGTPPTAATTSSRTSESGLGDIVAAATYNAYNGGEQGFVVDFSGRIKFGTASESKGLGSGENDYAIQANIDKNFGPAYASVGLGYKWLGEPPGANYRNIVYGSLGGGYNFTPKFSAGVSYDWATVAVSGAAKPQEVSVYGGYRINDHYKINGVLYTGLSNASSDIGGGLTLNYSF